MNVGGKGFDRLLVVFEDLQSHALGGVPDDGSPGFLAQVEDEK
ncbi:hypothetical protein LQF76_08530 [Gloeomargaritales cyanobacterium VI4D9]|nr:hypothetical protein LQF76_08530 [Gloeomargaritales cyanobacterium VI4D9]